MEWHSVCGNCAREGQDWPPIQWHVSDLSAVSNFEIDIPEKCSLCGNALRVGKIKVKREELWLAELRTWLVRLDVDYRKG